MAPNSYYQPTAEEQAKNDLLIAVQMQTLNVPLSCGYSPSDWEARGKYLQDKFGWYETDKAPRSLETQRLMNKAAAGPSVCNVPKMRESFDHNLIQEAKTENKKKVESKKPVSEDEDSDMVELEEFGRDAADMAGLIKFGRR